MPGGRVRGMVSCIQQRLLYKLRRAGPRDAGTARKEPGTLRKNADSCQNSPPTRVFELAMPMRTDRGEMKRIEITVRREKKVRITRTTIVAAAISRHLSWLAGPSPAATAAQPRALSRRCPRLRSSIPSPNPGSPRYPSNFGARPGRCDLRVGHPARRPQCPNAVSRLQSAAASDCR